MSPYNWSLLSILVCTIHFLSASCHGPCLLPLLRRSTYVLSPFDHLQPATNIVCCNIRLSKSSLSTTNTSSDINISRSLPWPWFEKSRDSGHFDGNSALAVMPMYVSIWQAYEKATLSLGANTILTFYTYLCSATEATEVRAWDSYSR